MSEYQIMKGDCLEVLKTLPAESIQTCVTSPPYYGLRDYGTATWEGGDPACDHNPQQPDGGDRADRTLPLGRGGVFKDTCAKCGAKRIDNQIGLEQMPAEYIARLVAVFAEVRRVLKDDGTLWLNLGDSYAANGAKQTGRNDANRRGTWGAFGDGEYIVAHQEGERTKINRNDGVKPKDLLMIPARVAIALQADGWYLRSEIIWHKPNPMPESVTDRPTKSHEMIYLLSKSPRYYYDAEAVKEPSAEIWNSAKSWKNRQDMSSPEIKKGADLELQRTRGFGTFHPDIDKNTRNRRDVWTVSTSPYKGAHFATFPPKLIEPCILAGSKRGDTVLDPFNGSGTTGAVSVQHGREYIGIELNPNYITLAHERIAKVTTELI